MDNILEIIAEYDNLVLFNAIQNNRLIGHAVEILANPIEIIADTRRVPTRNADYVEHTIALYTPEEFKNHFRMSRASVEILINNVGHRLPPKRKPQIHLEKKLLFTIWILSKPETFLACSDRSGIAQSSAHYIFKEIINIICTMMDDLIQWPNRQQCEENSVIFQQRSRGIPNVIGAIDGTHIFIKQPVGNTIDFYNRYQSHSVILQAVCDPRIRFLNISVGHPGRMHDARVFIRSLLYAYITNEEDTLIRPEVHIIGDCAYPLLQELLTPFRNTGHLTHRQIIYNMRFSSMSSIIERAFGLLKGKWRRLKYLDMDETELLNQVVTACCILHNFVINQCEEYDHEDDDEEEEIYDNKVFPPVRINERRRHQLEALKMDEIVQLL